MFAETVLKKQLKTYDFEYFIDVDYPDIIAVFIGSSWQEAVLKGIADDINKQLANKGQSISYKKCQGFMEFSFYRKG